MSFTNIVYAKKKTALVSLVVPAMPSSLSPSYIARIATNPNGNGGLFKALIEEGMAWVPRVVVRAWPWPIANGCLTRHHK